MECSVRTCDKYVKVFGSHSSQGQGGIVLKHFETKSLKAHGKCFSYLTSNDKDLFAHVTILSPVPLAVYIHGKNQLYGMELSTKLQLTDYHQYEVGVSKVVDLAQSEQSCFSGTIFLILLFIIVLLHLCII